MAQMGVELVTLLLSNNFLTTEALVHFVFDLLLIRYIKQIF